MGGNMRLRNKKTGVIVFVEDTSSLEYHSIAELNEEWEDYEEPKKYWMIDGHGEVHEIFVDSSYISDEKEIGNYFTTKEEALATVEKLKAWKRLKDNGYRFKGVSVEYDGYKIHLECDIMKKEHYTPTQDHKDMDTLFGGEDE